MYSNFITPPDFVDDPKHTVTVIDATTSDVELLGKMCQGSDITYNMYLYRSEMNNDEWLQQAIEKSDAVIINAQFGKYNNLYKLEKTYYYGDQNVISDAKKVKGILDYFILTQSE